MQKVIVDYLVKVTTDTAKGKGSWSSMAAEATKAGVAVSTVATGFAAAGAAAVALANDVTDTIDRLNTIATNSGLAVETVAGLEAVAKASGKELRNLIPRDLPKRIAEAAEGSGAAVKGFERLGVSVTDASGNLKSADTVLRETIDALSAVEDPTLKAAAAQEIFGARAQELTSALSDSGDLEAWIDFSRTYGTDVGPEAQRVTQQWQRSMAIFSAALQGAKNEALPLIDYLARVVTGLTAMGVAVKGFVKGGGLWGNWIGGVKEAYAEVDEFADAIKKLNTELATTADRVADVQVELDGWKTTIKGEDIQKFMGFVAIASGKIQPPKTGDGKPPSGGAGKRAKRWDDGLGYAEIAALESAASEFGAELAKNREAIMANTGALEWNANALLDAMGDGIAVDTTRSRTGELLGGAGAALDAFGAIMSGVATVVAPLFMPEQVVSQLEAIRQGVDELPEHLVAIPELLVGVLDGIAELPLALINALPEIALGVANAVFQIFTYGFDAFFQTFAEIIGSLPGDIAQEIADVLRDLMGNLNPFDGDGNFLFGMADKALDALPFFDTGGDVTRTGLAVVHEGERVLTQAEREALMTGMSRSATINVINPDPAAAARAVSQALGGGQRIRLGV